MPQYNQKTIGKAPASDAANQTVASQSELSFEEIKASWAALKTTLKKLSTQEVSVTAFHEFFISICTSNLLLQEKSDLLKIETNLLKLIANANEYLEPNGFSAESLEYINNIRSWFETHASACGFKNTHLTALNITPTASEQSKPKKKASPAAISTNPHVNPHVTETAFSHATPKKLGKKKKKGPENFVAAPAPTTAAPPPAAQKNKSDAPETTEEQQGQSTKILSSTEILNSASPQSKGASVAANKTPTLPHPKGASVASNKTPTFWSNIKTTPRELWKDFQHLPPVGKALLVLGLLATIAALITLFTVPAVPVTHVAALSLKLLVTTVLGSSGGLSMFAASVGCRKKEKIQSALQKTLTKP